MNWIFKNIGRRIIFPFYHTVSNKTCPHIRNLYPVKSIQQFEKELDFFQKYYHPISLETVQSHIVNNTQPEKLSFLLSFDDGLKECYTNIAPILKNRNLSAAFFINTDFADNQALFYRYKVSLIIESLRSSKFEAQISKKDLLKLNYKDIVKIDEIAKKLNLDFDEYLDKEKPYMNWKEIEELHAQGFYIGGHSTSHPYFNQISLEEQILQTKESIDIVVDMLGLDYRIFSFPFTDYGVTKSFFQKIYNEQICDLSFGTAGIKKDEFSKNIHRIPMDNCLDSPEKFIQKEILQFHFKRLINKETVVHPK